MNEGRPDPERERLRDGVPWRAWGPYLSERQWGTVREDYSASGDAWNDFTHEQARSRAYRWGEDGIGGFSDDQQRLCVALAMWNGRDPILKERLYGLTNGEGNHGEDVKELYYFLDATPTHSYLRMLYKYPQAAFPYERLMEENRRRGKSDPEFELLDTGLLEEDRYFDVEIEYAKAAPEDILLRVTATNRGPDDAELHLLPHLWFRNTWSWKEGSPRPRLDLEARGAIAATHPELGSFRMELEGAPEIYFCDNETNVSRLYGVPAVGFFKDAIHSRVVHGARQAVSPADTGTKAAAHFRWHVPARAAVVVRARLRRPDGARAFEAFDAVVDARRREADEFYARLQSPTASADERRVQRQALAGMIWSKQFYYLDVTEWLRGDPTQPRPPARRGMGRNAEWCHLHNAEVLSMPDTWEYPWFAAWDLAFHCVPLALVDAELAKQQLALLGREWYMHPNGQLPAYEWSFSDVNPPVHAWATWRVFDIDRRRRGDAGDLRFLERVFHKLLLNFTWWVNRRDMDGGNVFQGGFLGLDNIGVFDRAQPLPTGGHLDQSDGTAWMAMYSLDLLRIALELAMHNHVYEDIASKFFEHFLYIAEAMGRVGEGGLWDEQDGFYYDWIDLHRPEGGCHKLPLRVRSMVGLIPLFAVEVIEPAVLRSVPGFKQRLEWFLANRPALSALVSRWQAPGMEHRRLLSLLRGHRMKAILRRMLDENEFLSPYGVRALSRAHLEHPFRFEHDGRAYEVSYTPAESDSGLFGGNSNWRGPIWFPVNYLIIESLRRFHQYYGDDFKVECPTGSGRYATLAQVADELGRRLVRIFLRDREGRRPVFGESLKMQLDPHFRDHILFHEYFHGDSGRGVGASHQTGWTGLVADLIPTR
jgi:hypothetical protein